ncbi:MAG: hypothetical protein L5655_06635 [Thermosediminibacteraceae bacterium]|nr:hypothetical protein [Thermosediminibacteraceae bacterium]
MSVGAPSEEKNYQVHDVDGIKVYISPSVDTRNGLKIYLGGFGIFKNLMVATH